MKEILVVLGLVVVSGCAYDPCKGDQPYQQVRPRPPLEVPEGLSEPVMASSAPQVDRRPDLRRPDGRCLEEPPPYEPPAPPEQAGGN